MFEAALASLNDKSNRLRFNNFAYSIRELSRHFLYSLSPELNIKNCRWYKTETNDDKPTRAQRVRYAIQGGISDELLEDWSFDILGLADTIKSVVSSINSLNKYTHINPEVFDLKDEEVKEKSILVLETFSKFVETIKEYREELKKFLDGHIENHMINSVISNFFKNVDCLAPHHSLEYCEVSDYHISEINDKKIVVNVTGDLHVVLQYGSSSDRREGDGLDLNENFPFETKIRYEISEDFPSDNHEVDDYDVDTSKWYE